MRGVTWAYWKKWKSAKIRSKLVILGSVGFANAMPFLQVEHQSRKQDKHYLSQRLINYDHIPGVQQLAAGRNKIETFKWIKNSVTSTWWDIIEKKNRLTIFERYNYAWDCWKKKKLPTSKLTLLQGVFIKTYSGFCSCVVLLRLEMALQWRNMNSRLRDFPNPLKALWTRVRTKTMISLNLPPQKTKKKTEFMIFTIIKELIPIVLMFWYSSCLLTQISLLLLFWQLSL